MKYLLVAGPRAVADPFRLNLMIESYLGSRTGEQITVVHGAARGVDLMAAAAAERLGLPTQAVPVINQDRVRAKAYYGNPRKAPLMRTLRILDTVKPDELVAWWDGKSSGTGFTISQARRRRIPTTVYQL